MSHSVNKTTTRSDGKTVTPCVNPDHLHADNMRNTIRRSRRVGTKTGVR